MTKVYVINDLPRDVFSDHLLGNKSIELVRLGFKDLSIEHEAPIYLTVNSKINLAVMIKQGRPNSKVFAASGGEKDFQPVLTAVFGQDDYDDFTYTSWNSFDHLLLSDYARPTKLLIFNSSDKGNYFYTPNKKYLNSFLPESRRDFADFIGKSFTLSFEYLSWLKKWIAETSQKTFAIRINPKKKFSQFSVSLKNKIMSLPIFSPGDSVKIINGLFEEFILEPDISKDMIKTKVIRASVTEVTIGLSRPINKNRLQGLKFIRPHLLLLSQKIERIEHDLMFCKNGSERFLKEGGEAALLAHDLLGKKCFKSRMIKYPDYVVLTEATRKILRDRTQVAALLDMLSDKPISLIIGPAGTGKTFVSSVAVKNFVEMGYKVLLVSHSNLGVDNLVLEVAKHVNHGQIYRSGNDSDVIHPQVKKINEAVRLEKNGFVNACTIDGFLSLRKFREENYQPDVIFCDEASRGLFPEIWPLILAAKKKIIFIGDNKQLGNIPISQVIIDYLEYLVFDDDYERVPTFTDGFFNAMVNNQFISASMLRENRRSLPAISELISQVFYEGQLISGRFNPHNSGKVIFLDTKKLEAEGEKRDGTSWINPIEVNILIQRFISCAAKHIKEGGKIANLVIITPYKAQVQLLKKKLRKELLFHTVLKTQVNPENVDKILEDMVITVDAIQGGQRKIVFVSLVRSNENQEIGFNKDIRRLNVAMSRAQEMLVVIGNSETFIKCDHPEISSAFWQILIAVKKRGNYIILK